MVCSGALCASRFYFERLLLLLPACWLPPAFISFCVGATRRRAHCAERALQPRGRMAVPLKFAPPTSPAGFLRPPFFSQSATGSPALQFGSADAIFRPPRFPPPCVLLTHRFCRRAWSSILFGAGPASFWTWGSSHPSMYGLKITLPRSVRAPSVLYNGEERELGSSI